MGIARVRKVTFVKRKNCDTYQAKFSLPERFFETVGITRENPFCKLEITGNKIVIIPYEGKL